jgi:multicomponent Na+:H+ antiporter subunit B
MVRNILIFIVLAVLGTAFMQMIVGFSDPQSLGIAASHYASNGLSELGATNLVTSVVVTYRGLDTLGEVTVLFLTASILAFFLKSGADIKKSRPSELLSTASAVIFPFIFVTGVYIAVNGHLTPGGGFQGGAVLASSLLLMILADPETKGAPALFSYLESLSGIIYVLLGLTGLILAGGFLDATLLPAGKAGTLLSAGIIPIISVLIGVKVGAELSTLIVKLKNAGEEAE